MCAVLAQTPFCAANLPQLCVGMYTIISQLPGLHIIIESDRNWVIQRKNRRRKFKSGPADDVTVKSLPHSKYTHVPIQNEKKNTWAEFHYVTR